MCYKSVGTTARKIANRYHRRFFEILDELLYYFMDCTASGGINNEVYGNLCWFSSYTFSGLCLFGLTIGLTHFGVKLYLKYGKARLGPIFNSPTYMAAVWVVAIAFELYIIHRIYGWHLSNIWMIISP